MASSSGVYNYQAISSEIIIRESFELAGILPSSISAEQLESAVRSINFLTADWLSRNVNLWTFAKYYLPLTAGVNEYILPIQTLKITQAAIRSYTRQLNGLPQSNTTDSYDAAGGGNANNAFDGDSNTSCLQTASDGNISYDYGINNAIKLNFIGILSKDTTSTFNLLLEASIDSINWSSLQTIAPRQFTDKNIYWFDIVNLGFYRYYRVRETGGATLNISEIYFVNSWQDLPATELGDSEFFELPQKYTLGQPNLFSCDYQIVPKLSLYPTPNGRSLCFVYRAQESIQTLTSYTESINIPLSFYGAMTYGLASTLAVKYAPEKAALLQSIYNDKFNSSVVQNSPNLPLTLRPYGN